MMSDDEPLHISSLNADLTFSTVHTSSVCLNSTQDSWSFTI